MKNTLNYSEIEWILLKNTHKVEKNIRYLLNFLDYNIKENSDFIDSLGGKIINEKPEFDNIFLDIHSEKCIKFLADKIEIKKVNSSLYDLTNIDKSYLLNNAMYVLSLIERENTLIDDYFEEIINKKLYLKIENTSIFNHIIKNIKLNEKQENLVFFILKESMIKILKMSNDSKNINLLNKYKILYNINKDKGISIIKEVFKNYKQFHNQYETLELINFLKNKKENISDLISDDYSLKKNSQEIIISNKIDINEIYMRLMLKKDITEDNRKILNINYYLSIMMHILKEIKDNYFKNVTISDEKNALIFKKKIIIKEQTINLDELNKELNEKITNFLNILESVMLNDNININNIKNSTLLSNIVKYELESRKLDSINIEYKKNNNMTKKI